LIYKFFSLIAFTLLGVGIYYFYTNDPSSGEAIFVACISKTISGLDCPGCGAQRACHELLHGNFIKAAQLNLLIYFFAPLLLFIFLKITLKPFNIILPDIIISAKWLITIVALIILFTIIRNII
jgi:hypothetical protein|tara:strand:+ start:169 stop:540 length:372 start_codon:yes stop_codon:yes gene_type:complete